MRALSFVFAFFVLFSLAFSQPDSLNMKIAGVWETEDTNELVLSFAVKDSYLYIFTGISSSPYQKIYTINISDPSSPDVISEITRNSDLGEYPFGVTSSADSFLYAVYYGGHGLSSYGLGILDISQPEILNVSYAGHIVEGMRDARNYIDSTDIYLVCKCLIDSVEGIRILNVTDPVSPELLDWYYVPEPIYDSYYIMRHGLASFDVKYPYLFTFETIQAWDTSGGDGYYLFGWIQVKKFDLRDLSAPPIVWRTDEEPISEIGIIFSGGVAGDSGVFFSYLWQDHSYDAHRSVFFLGYDDSTLEELCEFTDLICGIAYVENDTCYGQCEGPKIMAIKLTESCGVETLGYYSQETAVSHIVVSNGYIYANDNNRIYIFSWIPDQIEEHGYLEKKEDYRVYPSPIIFGSKLVLNRPLNKASGIYDISGKLVKNIPKNRMRISTKDFSPGLYFLVSNDREIKLKFVVL